jgi:hypothetical protein
MITPSRSLAVLLLTLACLGTLAPAQQQPQHKNPLLTRGEEERAELLKDEGGSEASEKAVAEGLRWLALHQAADGHWGLHDFNKHARTAPLPAGQVVGDDSTPNTTRRDDVAATAFGLLPFLAAGHTHRAPAKNKDPDYSKPVAAGARWLIGKQVRQGKMAGHLAGTDYYSHSLAALALIELFSMTADPQLKAAAQLAVDHLVQAQHDAGGWRYTFQAPGDLSVTGFAYRALALAQRCGLRVPKETMQKADRFVAAMRSQKTGDYGYTAPERQSTPALTAVGVLCRLTAGAWDEGVRQSLGLLKPPADGKEGMEAYYTHFATQAAFQAGGEVWKKWNEGDGDRDRGVRDRLTASQDDGKTRQANKGTWEGQTFAGGRLGTTSLNLMTLQVYYRYPRYAAKK